MSPNMAPVDGGIALEQQEDEARERQQEQQDDERFAARRAAFVAWLHQTYADDREWSGLVLDCGYAMRSTTRDRFVRYAEVDGWPATLHALAQAMAESEKA